MSKICSKCGAEITDRCPSCTKAYMQAWRARNQERLKAYNAAWYQENQKPNNAARYAKYRDSYIERSRAAYQANPERAHEQARKWRVRNRDHLRAYEAERYRRDGTRMRLRNALWRKRNPERRAQNEARRRGRMHENGHERIDYQMIIERDQSICHICGLLVQADDLSFDHVIPLVKGGPHTMENIRVAHLVCNLRKKDSV